MYIAGSYEHYYKQPTLYMHYITLIILTNNSVKMDSIRAQADHIWKFLDELAQSDPKAYDEYIKNQMKMKKSMPEEEAQKNTFTPTPVMVIHTQTSQHQPVYVNITSSNELQPPLLKDSNPHKQAPPSTPLSQLIIPLSVGIARPLTKERTNISQSQKCKYPFKYLKLLSESSKPLPASATSLIEPIVVDVTFHPSVFENWAQQPLDKAPDLLGSQNHYSILSLALYHIQEDHKLKLDRTYTIDPEYVYVGAVLQQETESHQKSRQGSLKPEVKKDIILPSMLNEKDTAPSITKLKLSTEDKPETTNEKKSVLIEVVSEENVKPIKPHYTLEKLNGELIVEIHLPTISSSSDATVDITSNSVICSAPGYDLRLSLEQQIDETKSAAKWIKRKHILRIVAPLQQK